MAWAFAQRGETRDGRDERPARSARSIERGAARRWSAEQSAMALGATDARPSRGEAHATEAEGSTRHFMWQAPARMVVDAEQRMRLGATDGVGRRATDVRRSRHLFCSVISAISIASVVRLLCGLQSHSVEQLAS